MTPTGCVRILMATTVLDLVHADGADRLQVTVRQAPLQYPFSPRRY
jgi:hypothetical protein